MALKNALVAQLFFQLHATLVNSVNTGCYDLEYPRQYCIASILFILKNITEFKNAVTSNINFSDVV